MGSGMEGVTLFWRKLFRVPIDKYIIIDIDRIKNMMDEERKFQWKRWVVSYNWRSYF